MGVYVCEKEGKRAGVVAGGEAAGIWYVGLNATANA